MAQPKTRYFLLSMTEAQTAVIQCNKRTKCFANRPFINL